MKEDVRTSNYINSFIETSKKVHNNKYNYSKVNYINARTKVCIICPKHGEFWQEPFAHKKGCGCKQCALENNSFNEKNKNIFLEKVKKFDYDYSKVKYINNTTPICVICKKHGEFYIKPIRLTNNKKCPKCIKEEKMHNFIQKANEVHNNKYDYSKVDYVNLKEKVCIICPEHGEFLQKPSNHLRGEGCNICGGKNKLDNEKFIQKANEVHNNKYDYSKVDYKNNKTYINIICPKHGEFIQLPRHHLEGRGCPSCKSSKGEKIIRDWLVKNNISFEEQKQFVDCKYKNNLKFDFYLPNLNICIEFNGEQHYKSIEYFGGASDFLRRVKRDKIKNKYCIDNNIKLCVIKYDDNIIEKLKGEINERRC